MLKNKRFISILLALFVPIFALGTVLFNPVQVVAQEASIDEMCVPPTTKTDKGYEPTGWLKIEVINRATFKIIISPEGFSCVSPAGLPLSKITGSDAEGIFKKTFEVPLIDKDTSDTTWNYVNINEGGSSSDDSNLKGFDKDKISTGDSFSGGDAKVGSANFLAAVDKADLILSIENDILQGVVDCQAGGDAGNNIIFRDSDGMEWWCGANANVKGIIVGPGNFVNPGNFDITYKVSTDGQTIEHVSPNERDTRTFRWCDGYSQFRSNCNSSSGYLYFDGVTPESLTGQADNSNIALTIKKEGSNESLEVSVAGANTDAAIFDGETSSENGLGAAGGDTNPTCETSGFNLSWVFCPLINGALDASDWFFRVIVIPYLQTNPITTDSEDTIFIIWSSFRTLGNILLIFGLLFIVFGQAIGGGLVDAYTAKKAMPRILVAAIAINLSIYVVAVLVDVFNVVGVGLGQLITSPLQESGNFNFSFTGGNNFIGPAGILATVVGGAIMVNIFSGAGAGAATDFLVPILFFVVVPLLIAVISIFATLIIRRGIIIFLAIISPIALALYVLPGTEKYAKQWLNFLIKALIVYPIVMVIFAVADVLSTSIYSSGSSGAIGGSVVSQIVALVVLFVPFFMIPFAFKLAGGAMNSIYGAMSGVGKKGRDFVAGNPQDPNSLQNRMKGRFNNAAARGASNVFDNGKGLPGTNPDGSVKPGPSRWRRGQARTIGAFGSTDARLSKYNKQEAQLIDDLSATGDDSEIFAAAGWTEKDRSGNTVYRNSKGKQIDKLTYDQGKAKFGNNMSRIQRALEYTVRKIQTDEDAEAYRRSFAENAQQNNWSDTDLMGVHAGATYPHKPELPSIWYSTPGWEKDAAGNKTGNVTWKDVATDTKSFDSMMGDLHRTRASYQFSSIRDQTWDTMFAQQKTIEDKLRTGGSLTNEEASRLATIYETVDAAAPQMGWRPGVGADGAPDASGSFDPSVSSGASPRAKGVLEASLKNRADVGAKLDTTMNPDQRELRWGGTASLPTRGGAVVNMLSKDGKAEVVNSSSSPVTPTSPKKRF